jgi:Ser/Thr protein kinase RdoA (MazF antagonist)
MNGSDVMSTFPVTRSILSAPALSEAVVRDYGLAVPTDCQFLQWGLNDTYLLKSKAPTYVLRIYRRGWRSLSEIQYEVEALLHMQKAGIAVSVPVRRHDGTFVGTIAAPEGIRYMVLFTYAPGREPTYDSKDDTAAYHYGKLAAQIHTATATFQSPHQRVGLDLEHLLEIPLRSIEPMLAHRLEDWKYLQTLTEKLRRWGTQLPFSNLEQGFCHGDLHWGNAHLQDDHKTLTVFDFDCCGVGWRAYDLAVFRWAARLRKKEQAQWPVFLRGYRDERTIHEREIQAIPYFVALRHLWLLGLHTASREDCGTAWMNEAYFDEAITFLRTWGEEHLCEPR